MQKHLFIIDRKKKTDINLLSHSKTLLYMSGDGKTTLDDSPFFCLSYRYQLSTLQPQILNTCAYM